MSAKRHARTHDIGGSRSGKSWLALELQCGPTTMKLTCLVLAVLTATAAAQPAEPTAPAPTRDDPTVSLTFSPLHLFIPMAEVTAEFRVAPKVGLAVVGGVGMIRDQTTNERISLLEGGASIRYYALGSFRSGAQIGFEALYLHAATTDMSIDVRGRGIGLSPFVGYKWTHTSGFTFDGQIGVTYVTASAESTTATASASKIGPMLNLNVGWTL
jgi:uncharacterized protein DUF3575